MNIIIKKISRLIRRENENNYYENITNFFKYSLDSQNKLLKYIDDKIDDNDVIKDLNEIKINLMDVIKVIKESGFVIKLKLLISKIDKKICDKIENIDDIEKLEKIKESLLKIKKVTKENEFILGLKILIKKIDERINEMHNEIYNTIKDKIDEINENETYFIGKEIYF